jgi:tetrapyrrole methylase family protein/MazG family protein
MDEGVSAIVRLLEIIRILRGPEGCRWDREQTMESLRPYLLEEAYEVAEAAERREWGSVSDELGDLLLHVLMWCEIASEKGLFSLEEVAEGVRSKLVRRHPHVFQGKASPSPEEVERQWEDIKRREKESSGRAGIFESVPRSMPALQTAWRVCQRARDAGVAPLPDESGLNREWTGFKGNPGEDSLGELLLALSGFACGLGIEPELALRKAVNRFVGTE